MTKRFDFKSIENFDNHISSSIKGYDLLYELIANISGFFLNNRRKAVDYGCTSGKLIHRISETYSIEGIGYDITSKNFLDGRATLYERDITRAEFTVEKADIYYLVFTLQFLREHDRYDLLTKIFQSMDRSAILIVCEKEISDTGFIQEAYTFSNYDYKKKAFSSEEILEKEEQLRSTMRCMTSDYNRRMFNDVGFKYELFFKSLNFSGYILHT